MDGNKSLIQAKIRDAIDKGVLTRDSIERGLQALIDEEIAQNERPANQNLINACLDLFDDLHEESECAHRDASTLSRMAAHATAHTRSDGTVKPYLDSDIQEELREAVIEGTLKFDEARRTR